MPVFHCCFLDRNGHTERMLAIRAADASAAQREAMNHMTEQPSFSGFELWGEGQRIITYKPPKDEAPEQADFQF